MFYSNLKAYLDKSRDAIFRVIRENLGEQKLIKIFLLAKVKMYCAWDGDGEFARPHFKSKKEVALESICLEELGDKMIDTIFESRTEFLNMGSDWAVENILGIIIDHRGDLRIFTTIILVK